MSNITPDVRRRAEALPPRERKRLRRNYLIWEGRLDRALDSLKHVKLCIAEGEGELYEGELAGCEQTVKDCRAGLAKATKQINDALGTTL